MSELNQIKIDIAVTKADLVQAKNNGASEAMLISLQNTLAEQQKKENLLLGDFIFLFLIIYPCWYFLFLCVFVECHFLLTYF